ncbi:MAG: type II toxin-antitoxin system prevent-host-death family antitoxin [Myxococcota bacterium]
MSAKQEYPQEHRGEQQISVRDANQGFSKLIGRVEVGERFLVTKNNRPVARIIPVETEEQLAEARRQAAINRLKVMMAHGRASRDGWTFKSKRDALHDRTV